MRAGAAIRVPGTTLRFGAALEALDSTFVAAPSPDDTTMQVRKGPIQFFGVAATATLAFRDGRLTTAEFAADSTSPAARAYIEDELSREGYHKRCQRWEPDAHACDWSGRAEVHLDLSPGAVKARMREAAPIPMAAAIVPANAGRDTAAAAARASGGGATRDSTPQASRLGGGSAQDAPVHLEGARVIDSCLAVRPAAARKAGVFGLVVVNVLVNGEGRVAGARIVRGVPELNQAALECARRYRFELPAGTGTLGWTPVTIRFTQ